ncbi:MAG: SGNH/GDSL hydrolase family protein [Cyanobacteriota bacterium]
MSSEIKSENFLSKLIAVLRYIWIIIGITLLIFLILDFISGLLMNKIDSVNLQAKCDEEAKAFNKPEWYENYFFENEKAMKIRWSPYIYWRRESFEGKNININQKGLRQTWNKDKGDSAPKKIFVFGGSTTWGTGVRDNYTIPSQLSRFIYDKTKYNVEVTNFGELGFVSTQELIALIKELQLGNVPDIVIFYDGNNDVYASYQNGVPGVSHNEFNRIKNFNLENDKSALYKAAIAKAVESSGIYRLIYYLRGKFFGVHIDIPDYTSDRLIDYTLRFYIVNIMIIENLGKLFSFKTLFYWQPNVFFKEQLTDVEKNRSAPELYLKDFYKNTYKQVTLSSYLNNKSNFHNISEIFMDDKDTIFIDYCHLNEEGNKVIAERMFNDLKSILDSENDIK